MYKAIVFDNDGTLLNGSSVIGSMYRVYKELRPNSPLEEKDFEICYFMSPEKTWEYLGINGNQEEIDYFVKEAIWKNKEDIFPEISSLLMQLKEMGLILGMNTSRSHKGWLRACETLGEETVALFDYTITSDQVENHKPAPDSLHLFMKKSGLKSKEILYIGDSIYDAECAHAAGCDFGLAAWGFHQNVEYQEKYRFSYCMEVLELLQQD